MAGRDGVAGTAWPIGEAGASADGGSVAPAAQEPQPAAPQPSWAQQSPQSQHFERWNSPQNRSQQLSRSQQVSSQQSASHAHGAAAPQQAPAAGSTATGAWAGATPAN